MEFLDWVQVKIKTLACSNRSRLIKFPVCDIRKFNLENLDVRKLLQKPISDALWFSERHHCCPIGRCTSHLLVLLQDFPFIIFFNSDKCADS